MRVEAREVVALLGRNGAGKTTTLRTLMGVVAPRSGSIRLDGAPIEGQPPFATWWRPEAPPPRRSSSPARRVPRWWEPAS